LESALLLVRKGYKTTILCSGTYLGEDITGTWKWYPEERQKELRKQLDQIAKRFNLSMPQAGLLFPGTIKRLFMEWVRSAGIKVCYMTRLFGAVVQNNQLTGIVAADKQGLFYLPCTLVIDATLHHEATRIITGKPLRFPKDHLLTIRLELRNVNCNSLPHRFKENNAVLMKGIRDASQAYLELERYLPREMSMQEVRGWALANIRDILSQLHQYPETAEAIPGETLPYVMDLGELVNEAKAGIDGWYTEIPDKFDIANFSSPTDEIKLLVHGRFLPIRLNQGEEVIIDWELLPKKETGILVTGAGTSGIWAAISAARAGAKVCAVEMLPYPGGTRVMGGVNSLYYGNRNQLFQSLWKEIKEFTDIVMGRRMPEMLHVGEILFYASEMEKNNIEFLSNTIACGAEINNKNDLTGVLFCGENGPYVVYAQRYIDATGDADVAALAGCSFDYGDEEMHVMQNYSQWKRCVPERSGYCLIDQDTMDQTKRSEWARALEWNLTSLSGDYDMYDMLTVRESRRIRGRDTVTFVDAVRGKRTPDILYEVYSTYDPHGRCMNIYGRLGLMPAQSNPMFIAIPLGSLLPKGINNLVVVGKAISTDQDTFNYIRMNADIMCVGWIAGMLCARSIHNGVPVDALPLSDLQEKLNMLGAITLSPPKVDTYSTSPHRIAAEILAGEENGFRNAVITNWNEIRDIIRTAYEMGCYKSAELVEKTLLWFGDTSGAQHLTEVLDIVNQRVGRIIYDDRQKNPGFTKGGIIGELDDYWFINQLVILLSRAHYTNAIPVICEVLHNTDVGSGWKNDTSQYISGRLDCQSIANYDRILCLAEAAVLMPSDTYVYDLTRLFEDIESQDAPPAPFYKEYLQIRLLAAMKACGSKETEKYLNSICNSRYSVISEYARKLLADLK